MISHFFILYNTNFTRKQTYLWAVIFYAITELLQKKLYSTTKNLGKYENTSCY